jgi:hypothetical protein
VGRHRLLADLGTDLSEKRLNMGFRQLFGATVFEVLRNVLLAEQTSLKGRDLPRRLQSCVEPHHRLPGALRRTATATSGLGLCSVLISLPACSTTLQPRRRPQRVDHRAHRSGAVRPPGTCRRRPAIGGGKRRPALSTGSEGPHRGDAGRPWSPGERSNVASLWQVRLRLTK